MVRLLLMVVAIAGCSTELCRDTCDGCCKQGLCVPLALTSRTQCGRGGAECVNGDVGYCPVCVEGSCGTGLECWGSPPPICECGGGGFGACAWSCGRPCSGAATCVNNQCVPPDGGMGDGGAGDAQ